MHLISLFAPKLTLPLSFESAGSVSEILNRDLISCPCRKEEGLFVFRTTAIVLDYSLKKNKVTAFPTIWLPFFFSNITSVLCFPFLLYGKVAHSLVKSKEF